MKPHFDHEKLDVYKSSIQFVSWVDRVLEKLPKSLAVADQLDRASTSIPLNLAEGNGRFTEADRCRFFDMARGSALECAACLDVLQARNRIDCAEEGKALLARIVSMIVGLIRSTSSSRLHEQPEKYDAKICSAPVVSEINSDGDPLETWVQSGIAIRSRRTITITITITIRSRSRSRSGSGAMHCTFWNTQENAV